MFRAMRKNSRQESLETAEQILKQGRYGVLSVQGDEGYPYGVPVNYVYDHGKLYFHCALEGHKLDSIEKNPKVSFCVVGKEQVWQEKFTTCYESAIAFGTAKQLHDKDHKRQILIKLIEKYCADFLEKGQAYAEKSLDETGIVEITIEHLTAKGNKGFEKAVEDLSFGEMMEMQKNLWKKHAHEWSPMTPAYAKESMLWMIEEIGECIAVIKKQGDQKIMEDPAVRSAFLEEMGDVLMYFNDVLLRYGCAPKEIAGAYVKKYEKNIHRNFTQDNTAIHQQMENRLHGEDQDR